MWPGLGPGLPSLEDLHDAVCIVTFPQKIGHDPHRTIGMGEESLVAGAKVVSVPVAILRFREAVLGAFAVAGKQILALTTRTGQVVALVLTELVLLSRVHELD
jgi:hypothetical protein